VEEDVEVLQGGVANAGAVIRQGGHVLRPANPHSSSILHLLHALAGAGFTSAPVPVGIEPDGHERLHFIPGDVAIPPYPDWAQADGSLISAAGLLRSLHDASERIDTTGMTWSPEMADPAGGTAR
jgi:hypothetical protein